MMKKSSTISRSATAHFDCTHCLVTLGLLLLLFAPAHNYALHKHSGSSGSGSGAPKSSDLATGDLKLPASWLPIFRRSNHDKQGSLPAKAAAAVEEDEFNHEVLGDVDNSSSGKDSDDARQYHQSSHGFEVADMKAADSLLAIDATASEDSSKEKESMADKLDRLIREIDEESKKEKEANQVDNSFQQAEAIKAKLDFEINRTRLILMRLRSLQRNVADAHFLAKKLVESDVVSQNIKDSALTNLDKSVETVKKVLVKM